MSRSGEVYSEVRRQLVDGLGLSMDGEGWAIVESVWEQTIGGYVNTEAANQRDPWNNDRRFRMFVRKWAFFVAGEIQQSAANPTGADADSACRRAIRHAHEECTAVIAAGGTPIDPAAFVEHGPFCTIYLRGGA